MLVTGAGGMLGRHLVPVLRQHGHEVVAADRSDGDLGEPTAARRVVRDAAPDAVVHLAGGPGERPEEMRYANVDTVRNVLTAAGETGRPHVVVIGSAAEYGDGEPAGGLIGEDAPLRPVTEYGRAKVAATVLATDLAQSLGIPLTVARPFNVVGARPPARTPLGNLSAQLLAQDGPERLVRCGRLDVVRDFVPATFVAEALTALVEGRHLGVVNVCSGIGTTPGEVLAAMGAVLGVEVRVEPVPELVALPAADRVVGDPGRLAALGVRCRPTSRDLAELCLGGGQA
ncbi:GDP-mannose 4,6-dehydratase [Sporichthya brevicatena]|uniref:GDP-mannose 4,6-dehydratase n=1 Tax=Sporichthya brevicatena TaxID=171442 RepID=A0ABN1H5V7_9ACTN